MAENSLRYSLQAKKEVLGTTDASFDMKLTLEDDSELLESHATPSQQQPKVNKLHLDIIIVKTARFYMLDKLLVPTEFICIKLFLFRT